MDKLFVGNAQDFEQDVKDKLDWAVVHACKEPYHRELLSYTTPGAPKDDPEYLVAIRDDEMFCNLVDAPKKEYIPEEIIFAVLNFIDNKLKSGKTVLIHCNQGESRAPTLALMYMIADGKISGNLQEILNEFLKIYPSYLPGVGMLDTLTDFIERR